LNWKVVITPFVIKVLVLRANE